MPVPSFSPEYAHRRRLLFQRCQTKEEAHAWVYTFLDVDLPDVIVDPDSTCTPLQMVWDIYSHFVHYPEDDTDLPAERLYYANRFGGKTLGMAIVEVMILLHVGTNIIHLAALLQQSEDAQRYLKSFFHLPDLRGFMVGSNQRTTEAIQYVPYEGGLVLTEREWSKCLTEDEQEGYQRIAAMAEVVVATMSSVNGKHGGLLIQDELDLTNPRVVNESKNIPTPIRRPGGGYINPLTVMTSTRKSAYGPVQSAIDNAKRTGLVVKHWNILETTAKCPPKRHLPLAPRTVIYRSDETLDAISEEAYNALSPKVKEKYVRDEGYEGCLTKCKIFAACRGLLACGPGDSEFLKPVSDTINKIRTNSIDEAKAQLMCRKPTSTGLIYGSLLTERHILTPADAYAMVSGQLPAVGQAFTKADLVASLGEFEVLWYGGQDYGFTHFFAFPVGFRFGNKFFVTRALAAPQLDPTQKLEYSEQVRHLNPRIYGDTESPSDVALFRSKGWQMMHWQKRPGSLKEGIEITKYKLAPVGGEPELYFVFDVGEDEEMALMLKQMREYHWVRDAAGNPTDVPDKVDDDLCDGLRYIVMNVFPHRKTSFKVAGMETGAPAAKPEAAPPTAGNAEMIKIIEDATGRSSAGPGAPGAPGNVIKKGRLMFIG